MTDFKDNDLKAVHKLEKACEQINAQVGKVIIGQKQIIEELLISLLSRGHCLLVGVPGLAKTLLISTVAKVLDLKFKRGAKANQEEKIVITEAMIYYMETMSYEDAREEVKKITGRGRRYIDEAYAKYKDSAGRRQLEENRKRDSNYHPLFILD